MPIEIREIIIRAEIGQSAGKAGQPSSPGASSTGISEDLVQECVDQVMRIIEDKKER